MREGYEVRTIKSGKELIEAVEQTQPDLVIMDILLPEMNGLEVVKAIRAGNITMNIPILITSPLDVRERAIKAGANVFLLKPVNERKLMEAVRALLANSGVKEDKYGEA